MSLNATIYIKSFVLKKECVLCQTRAMDLAAQLHSTENRLRYLFPHMHRPSKLLDGHIAISPAALRRSLRDMRRRPLYRVTPKPYGINNQWNIVDLHAAEFVCRLVAQNPREPGSHMSKGNLSLPFSQNK